jgi:hypothetical protein
MEGASEARTMVAMTEKATVLVPAETRVVTATSYGSSLRAPSRLYLRAHKTFKRQQELAVRQGGARMWTWVGRACGSEGSMAPQVAACVVLEDVMQQRKREAPARGPWSAVPHIVLPARARHGW